MKPGFLFPFLFIVVFQGCNDSYFYKQSFLIENGRWEQSTVASFNLSIPDTSQIYNLHLDLEHGTGYAYENLYLLIKTSTPKGEELQKRINIDLADKGGKWYGKCGGKSCRLRINLQPNAFFDKAGDYNFSFQQYMRENPLTGINELTFIVEETGQTR